MGIGLKAVLFEFARHVVSDVTIEVATGEVNDAVPVVGKRVPAPRNPISRW